MPSLSHIKTMSTITAVSITEKLAVAKAVLKTAREEFIASLPEANAENMAYELGLARAIHVSGKSKVGEKYRLTDAQETEIATAKAEHETHINTPEKKAECIANVTKCTLTSYKIRQTSKGIMLKVSGKL